MSKKLKAGLEWFIKKVETIDPSKKFYMSEYSRCVIGTTMGLTYWEENEILKRKFDINRKECGSYFSSDNLEQFLPHQKDVIRLFTSACCQNARGGDDSITAKDWLVLAKDQLAKM